MTRHCMGVRARRRIRRQRENSRSVARIFAMLEALYEGASADVCTSAAVLA